MATLIRLAGETEEEFQKRAGAWMSSLAAMLFSAKDYDRLFSSEPLIQHLKLSKLRESCGFGHKLCDGDTFRWEVHTDAPD